MKSGFVNLIKPTGMGSTELVSKVKRILGTKKVGHLGTLDPAASGVLPIAVGRATRFFDYFLNKDKVYVARVKFGVETDTLDSFGTVTRVEQKPVSLDEIKRAASKFLGKIKQTPPKFSAKKVNGKRAYDLARANEDFSLEPKEIEILSISVKETSKVDEFLFEVHCSAGTYIRTLMSDIAHEIDRVLTVSVIIRTKSGAFDIMSAQTLDEFEASPSILTIQEVFDGFKFIEIDRKMLSKILCGKPVMRDEIKAADTVNGAFFLTFCGKLVGMFEFSGEKLQKKIFLFEENADD